MEDVFGKFQSQGDQPIRIRNIVETRRKQAASLIQSYDEQMKKSMGSSNGFQKGKVGLSGKATSKISKKKGENMAFISNQLEMMTPHLRSKLKQQNEDLAFQRREDSTGGDEKMSSKGFSIAKMHNTNSKLHQSFNKSAWAEIYLPLHAQSPNQQHGHSQSDSKKNKLSYSQSFTTA